MARKTLEREVDLTGISPQQMMQKLCALDTGRTSRLRRDQQSLRRAVISEITIWGGGNIIKGLRQMEAYLRDHDPRHGRPTTPSPGGLQATLERLGIYLSPDRITEINKLVGENRVNSNKPK